MKKDPRKDIRSAFKQVLSHLQFKIDISLKSAVKMQVFVFSWIIVNNEMELIKLWRCLAYCGDV